MIQNWYEMSMLEHCIRNGSLPWSSLRLPRKSTVSRSPWREPLSVLSPQSMCHHLPSRFPPRLLQTTPGKLREEAETVQDVVEATRWSTHVGVWSDEEYLATKEARTTAHKKCEMIPRCVITVSLDTMRYTLPIIAWLCHACHVIPGVHVHVQQQNVHVYTRYMITIFLQN